MSGEFFSSVGFSLCRNLIAALRVRNEEAKECVGLCTAGLWPAFLNLGFARTAKAKAKSKAPAGGQRYKRQRREERCRVVRQAGNLRRVAAWGTGRNACATERQRKKSRRDAGGTNGQCERTMSWRAPRIYGCAALLRWRRLKPTLLVMRNSGDDLRGIVCVGAAVP